MDSHSRTAFSLLDHMASVSVTKRMSYTVAFKLQVVELAEKSGNRSAAREHGINEKLIRDWRKKKAELEVLPRTARLKRLGVDLEYVRLILRQK